MQPHFKIHVDIKDIKSLKARVQDIPLPICVREFCIAQLKRDTYFLDLLNSIIHMCLCVRSSPTLRKIPLTLRCLTF